ncbi:hypothetical protein CIL05_20140 [Virgibacillus profundi]|uniref:Uncharacterized protein n=1 Tax=Virgibacillus profundi TaxID=2024555 RepID=A0A2A2I9H9_9BACI|nr:hypothetical protein [Virgibacillus profundi]PAV27790.1 hypothetical protein CIL05_20140 [Virgibacillus profundi]PXY52012.1 hypothetical protein CIT14_20120 [Virgibacillus profundi]
MPYEKGGRADKRGNRYEIRWGIYQLLCVLEEKTEYVIFEAIGDEEEGVDIWVEYRDGRQEGQQCKGRNSANESWTYGDLNSKNILSKWKIQLDRGDNISVSLVSPLAFTYLEDLTSRAINSADNPRLFYKHQIKGSDTKFINFARNFCGALGFDISGTDEYQLNKMINYLSRIKYRQSSDGERNEIILDKIGLLFQGDESAIYDALVTWLIDGDILGKRIGVNQIHSFLTSKKIKLRNLDSDTRIFPRIQELNSEYKSLFKPLVSGIIDRPEAETSINQMLEGNSVIVHGAAGSGKSGLTESVIKQCEDKEVPYLAIKLDRRVPRENVKQWSKSLGLPSSLVHCLNSISKNTNAVIILDQLDALRWTLPHSSEALLVCAELIRQVKLINLERKKPISILFVCRTYDLDNDNNIKNLFSRDEEHKWKKVEVGELKEEVVKAIVGSNYYTLTHKLKKLLKLPSNLYIWQKLYKQENDNEVSSTYHLVTKWWKQLIRESVQNKLNENDLEQAKFRMIEEFEKSGELSALSTDLGINSSTIDFLVSSGFIVKQDIGTFSVVSFVHQSLYDCFIAEKMFIRYLKRESVIEIIGGKETQTPARRYQMQMFLQSLYENSEEQFLSTGRQILKAPSIRFSFKYVFLELLNQIIEPTDTVKKFILDLVDDEKLGVHIVTNVVQGNREYIQTLRENGILDKWITTERNNIVISLYQSIRGKLSQEDVKFIERHIFDVRDDIHQWLRCFPFDVMEDSDDLFELRMRLYHKYPEYMETYMDIKALFKGFEMRAIDIITLMYETKKKKDSRFYRYEEKFLDNEDEFLVQNSVQVLEKLLPLVPKDSDYAMAYSDWGSRSRYNNSIERTIINVIKKANVALIHQHPELFWEIYKRFMGKGYILINELILDGLKYLPESDSNQVVLYLIEDIEANMFVKGSNDELQLSKEVLSKHFKGCSSDIQNQFLQELILYYPSDAVERYKRRLQYNSENKEIRIYWSFWGDFQHEILGAIPDTLLNEEALALKRVLSRRFKEKSTRFRSDIGDVKWVRSPVEGKDLSDRAWQKILTSKKLSNRSRGGNWKEIEGAFIESSLEQFSSNLSKITANEPLRMVSLVLGTRKSIHDLFIDALFSGLSTSEHLNTVPSYLIERLIERFPTTNDSYRANSVCYMVMQHKEEKWSENIFKIIKYIATNHLNPEMDNPVITNATDKEMCSAEMLVSNAINCVRGNVARTIGELLWKDDALLIEFKDTIIELTLDENPAVQYASLYALWPSYNIDRKWATDHIIRLYQKDIRNVIFPDSNRMLFYLYENYKQEVLDVILKCFESKDQKIIEVGAYILTEMYFQKGEFIEVFENINLISQKQAESILSMTLQYFQIERYKEQAKELIIKFDAHGYDIELSITNLLYNNLINLNSDRKFLHQVLQSNISRKIAYAFSEYIEKSAESIAYFSSFIFELSYSVINNSGNQPDAWGAEDEISKLIIGLYDEASGESHMKEVAEECLEIWDLMFEKQIGSARKLSFELMQR